MKVTIEGIHKGKVVKETYSLSNDDYGAVDYLLFRLSELDNYDIERESEY